MVSALTEEGQHEDSVVADSKLVGVAEVVSGGELVILARRRADMQSVELHDAVAVTFIGPETWPRFLPVASSPQRRQPWWRLWPSPPRHTWAARWRRCRVEALGSPLGNCSLCQREKITV